MFRSLRFLAFVALVSPVSCAPAQVVRPGCGKDTDCKGPRVCMAGTCIEAPTRTSPVAAEPAAAEVAVPAAAPVAPTALAGSQFHGDAHHSGRYPGRLPVDAPRELARYATLGSIFGGVALHAGAAVFGAHDRGLYAVTLPASTPAVGPGNGAGPSDLGTPDGGTEIGALRWRADLGDLVWATPAVGDGVVYAGSDADAIVALDARTGSLRWRMPTGPCKTKRKVGPEGARCDVDGIALAPDGTIYAAADGLYALRPDGSLKWRFSPSGAHCGSHPAIADDGTIYIGCQDDVLYAVTPDGQKKWDLRTGDDVDSSPAIGPDGTIYVGSDDKKLWAVSPEGNLRYALITGGAVRSSPAIGADGSVYFGSFDGQLYALAPGGTVRWTYRAADRIASSPILDADGAILFGSQDDRLYALEPDGKLRWSFQLDGDVDGTPTLTDDGLILVGADDRALHILK